MLTNVRRVHKYAHTRIHVYTDVHLRNRSMITLFDFNNAWCVYLYVYLSSVQIKVSISIIVLSVFVYVSVALHFLFC